MTIQTERGPTGDSNADRARVRLATSLEWLSRAANVLLFPVPAIVFAAYLTMDGLRLLLGVSVSSVGALLQRMDLMGTSSALTVSAYLWVVLAAVWFFSGYFARALAQRAQGSADSAEAPPAPPRPVSTR